jgi:DNA repair protein RadC
MTKIQGMGPVKAQVLKAALELARRMSVEQIAERPTVISPHEAASVVRERTRILDKEVFWVLMLDTKNRLMEPPEEVARGILDTCLVHPREVFRTAVRIAAASVIIVHNHPSGDCTPSIEDIRMTRQLVEAGRILDIQVLDHIVVGRRTAGQEEDFISMRESGLVAF